MKQKISILLCTFTVFSFFQISKWKVMFPVLCLPDEQEAEAASCMQQNENEDYEVRFYLFDLISRLKFSEKHK